MDKISKMVYEAPFIEIVPTDGNLLGNVFSDWDDGHGGKHKFGEDNSEGREGMGKEFGFESYDSGWDTGYDFDD